MYLMLFHFHKLSLPLLSGLHDALYGYMHAYLSPTMDAIRAGCPSRNLLVISYPTINVFFKDGIVTATTLEP